MGWLQTSYPRVPLGSTATVTLFPLLCSLLSSFCPSSWNLPVKRTFRILLFWRYLPLSAVWFVNVLHNSLYTPDYRAEHHYTHHLHLYVVGASVSFLQCCNNMDNKRTKVSPPPAKTQPLHCVLLSPHTASEWTCEHRNIHMEISTLFLSQVFGSLLHGVTFKHWSNSVRQAASQLHHSWQYIKNCIWTR